MADDHAALITEFQSITQENEERSRFYLESANWQLQVALGSFYDNSGPGEADMDFQMPPSAAAQSPSDMDIAFSEVPYEPTPQNESLTKTKPPSGGSSRMRSLADYTKRADDSDEDEGQEFYAGGSEHSGEVIIGPGKKRSGEEIVKNMFESAKKHGAVPAEEDESSQKKKGPKYFTGGGYKLGETDTDHQFIPGAAGAVDEGSRRLDVVLKLWRDGFTVGDGPLREYNNPENREFLHSVSKGDIPQELIKQAKGGEVNLDMEDHKNEEYKPVKKKMQAFTGEGHTLGSPTPTVVTNEVPVEPRRSDVSSVDPPVIINEGSPTTTLRVQMGDGSRVTQKFNHTHTVADLYSFVRDRDPSGRHFVLMTTFPNKELAENSASLKEGNLLNAVIVQRYK